MLNLETPPLVLIKDKTIGRVSKLTEDGKSVLEKAGSMKPLVNNSNEHV